MAKDYKKSATKVGKYAAGGAVTSQGKPRLRDIFKQYQQDFKAGKSSSWQFGPQLGGRGMKKPDAVSFAMGFIPYLRNYKKMQVPK